MNWANVKLILHREIRDQLRDRRTLFMIAVLPILLYPLLGMSFFQVAQFVREHATKIYVIGEAELPAQPRLIEVVDEKRRLAPRLFTDARQSRLLELHFASEDPDAKKLSVKQQVAYARLKVQQGEYQAAIHFPSDFADQLERVRRRLENAPQAAPDTDSLEQLLQDVPSPQIYYTTAREASAVSYARVSDVLRRWTDEIGRGNLKAGGVPQSAARPFSLTTDDVAEETGRRGGAVWSKVLPFLLLVWALTGAFYPAVDLCAGEKERGTLETLLSSPAERSEIVVGKLLTVMAFSMMTAILNLVSMAITGQLILSRLPDFGPPPALAPLWLFVALVPVSALFSALCLALAAFARSTKEGQYYLMPLLLVTMPLVMLPMSPGFELNLGNSLIPVTGVVLLLRSMLEGASWGQVAPFVPPVAAVTLSCCLLAVRWAVDQFNSESVLFRESEKFDFNLWIRHLMRDREDTPNVAAAAFCGILILTIRFFMSFALNEPGDFTDFARLALMTQLVVVLTPALIMTIMLTNSPRKTLLLNPPPLLAVGAAILLAVTLHPAVTWLRIGVMKLYPISDELTHALDHLFKPDPPLWLLLTVIAIVPAICEELAFRGFVLSGLRHLGSKWRAIFLTSLLFAMTHSIFQQSLIACLLGMVIGYLAVQSGSLLPAVCFHMVHNALGILSSFMNAEVVDRYPLLNYVVVQGADGDYRYLIAATVVGGLLAAALLYWFHSLDYSKTPEESLHEAIDQETAPSAV